MKSKILVVLIVILVLTITLYGCSPGNASTNENSNDYEAELQEKQEVITTLTAEKDALEQEVLDLQTQLQNQLQSQPSSSLLMTALDVVELLKEEDMDSLSDYIHPNQGVRFTPYAYVDVQNNLVFTAQQIETLLQTNQIYNWGAFDGTGDPIDLTFSDYYNIFVYDVDFANPHMIGNNVTVGTGNSINNIDQAYPNGMFVEFHFTGFDPGLFEMDWKSLRLVFEDVNGIWYLVGVVHDQWTI